MAAKSGFTLLELMIVVAITAILASFAIPAYVNYKNRAIQAEAVEALLRAKMDQELFWAENNRYAGTIGCLTSFGSNCSNASYSTPNAYTVQIMSSGTTTFRATAKKTFHSSVVADTLSITNASEKPVIHNTEALKFSIFKWLFD
jgi:type IV pilus assembly protein PilE